ncbi:UDP-3-O-(3-hydroxymyristoyl)glucosamine N-acyltransferase [Selenihalanaerobacter shriftii]|uniref:UDP-3-O-acylglucosamine N-acyltransferase n=1 Tax=Selenihalanaerobacter shriftii TaxID=142842 RepID=A0A1T4KYN2_9FIRM|nr:UDP-3-O-(3-hydroxymyristoyl)glucosamine N-acyltransferase [Selenihalanaerobacter shriftii]SJZ47574.1 UDP-3-O-[3-hydroxymyristoyl] glucosamine N-acyltransferase [Selenihalanaerobacter shriftii]
MSLLLEDLVKIVDGELEGDPTLEIIGVGGVNDVENRELTFAQNPNYLDKALASPASAIIVTHECETVPNKALIKVDNPRLAFAKIAQNFTPELFKIDQIHPTAVVADDVELGDDISIGPNVTIESGSKIGDGARIAAGVYIGSQVSIGDNTLLHPNVVINAETKIGSEVIIQAGTVVGSDGYGYESTDTEHYKVPQLGDVIIEDKVELGANVTIDRAATGSTIIGEGTKVDNLVHIAHNVKLGRNCLVIAQVGIAGSAQLGDWVTLAGKAGVIGHLTVGDNVTVAAQSIVTKDVPSDSFYSGYPARDHKSEMRVKAARRKLPNLIKELNKLKREVKELENKIDSSPNE